ncbi:hypothetical protein A2645_00140 [Candidatus Nomurabacteria bacterium RIFCSPHIGHO2_01_FULL_39_9]|uniref:DNA replication/recombination mediator RecO N-terminal domain-containing protein n=1 Tax=Candidatus Nomurabacteria bacterium RIFCSPHIGHO2_01_FULL_39_9 TaxID=1801735 RepID=A0A1F6UXP8_9BACT|nr:MAG: hypothetical protein A2645_00140 [Candidatus Nomurabacteria bacterium RIFCSPHIGHO2_01_FULL_39_9]
MYPVYSTEGIILGSKDFGEASRIFLVFTREFGLIRLQGQSIRKITSKLRYQLEDYSLLKLEVIKGKEIWRPVVAEKILRFSQNFKTIVNISKLVLRLCDLEEKNELLFEDLKSGFLLLQKNELETKALEAVLVLRILSHLGYIGDRELLSFVQPTFDEDIFIKAKSNLVRIIPTINEALKQSQL